MQNTEESWGSGEGVHPTVLSEAIQEGNNEDDASTSSTQSDQAIDNRRRMRQNEQHFAQSRAPPGRHHNTERAAPRASRPWHDSHDFSPDAPPQPPRKPSLGSTGPLIGRPVRKTHDTIGPSGVSRAPLRSNDSMGSATSRAPPTRTPDSPFPAPTQLHPPTVTQAGRGIIAASRRVPRGPPPPTRSRLSKRPHSILRAPGTTPSTIQGARTVRLSVLPASAAQGDHVTLNQLKSATSFAPKRLLDIENGESIVVTEEGFLPKHRYQELDQEGALIVSAKAWTAPIAQSDDVFFEECKDSLQDRIQKGDVRDFNAGSEVGVLGGAWRGALRRLLVWSYDRVNAFRLTRALQLFLPFLTGYEAYLLGQLIEALDHGRERDIKYILTVAFQNRNVSRILVQQIGPRYDFLWHWSTMVTWNRIFDAWGQLPIVGITSFPATENFPSTRDHALASIFRIVLGEGNWLTRVVTQGREGIVTNDPNNVAQNLAAESNGFELANRNQYGTYFGRLKTNEFRFSHRLPTDESIVRTFVTQPMPTMLNNGVVHVLRQLAKHWHNMLSQLSGNFAHQRMEQLDPFETLRFHMPVVLLTLSSLRGRNRWDSAVLGPMIRRLQDLKPGYSTEEVRYLVRELQDSIVVGVCGGVDTMIVPLSDWLDAIRDAAYLIEEEVQDVYKLVSSVEIGIRLGHDLITRVGWKVPRDSHLKNAILRRIRGEDTGKVSTKCIDSALTLITPRDKRTLIELVKSGNSRARPAQLLLSRAKTLLQRELRRECMNETVRELSKGDYVDPKCLELDGWYWLEEGDKGAVHIYEGKVTGHDKHRFLHADTKFEHYVSLSSDSSVRLRTYVPVAEAISRAQRAFMNIELDHGKRFSYNAFMEFPYLRTALRRLAIIAQFACEELDNARSNVLAEVQRSNQTQLSIHELQPGELYYLYDGKKKQYDPFVCPKKYNKTDPEWSELARTKITKVPPQSMIVIGGGPTGLMTTLHCVESVLVSGGVMKLYEARDAFAKGGATFERAQIVRLDARWIAMMRYHLGTGFEDIYIPASGETDSQLGNSLPTQGFVEITIKDLENMLHVEVSKLWSKGLLQVHADAKAQYDAETNALTKLGVNLKVEDLILRRIDENGHVSNDTHSWKVVQLTYVQPIRSADLVLGEEYGIYVRHENAVLPYRLSGVDLQHETYSFTALKDGMGDVKSTSSKLPSVYPKGTKTHAGVDSIVIESVKKGHAGGHLRERLSLSIIGKTKFTMDVGHTHVVEAIGKPHGSKVHFSATTYEPYGVCCIQGLNISMGMHNFGEKRWGSGLLDDIRSQNDQNTRIVGDFTKMVRSAPVAKKMLEYMTDSKDMNWQTHFLTLVEKSDFPELNEIDPIVPKIVAACVEFEKAAPSFKRQTLQTRFFETGDNYYLGMELTREYDKWKNELSTNLTEPLMMNARTGDKKKGIARFERDLLHHIDRLWFEGVLEVIRTGDVYNPGARHRVPRLHLINSYTDTTLGSHLVGESFRLSDHPNDKYEIVIKSGSNIIVRNFEGYISTMSKSTMVRREGSLTRSPDGNTESKVSLATFPVGHYVNFRTMRLNDSEKGYVFALIGDEQATPHFMRYSGLTGACVNSMLFNNFVKQASEGVPFIDRFRLYSVETNWSNGEVVQRGTGANYGVDGFLRPGFPYAHGIDYLHSKLIEHRESKQDLDHILSRDWKVKIAASMIPRGMEMNESFVDALYQQLQVVIFDKFVKEAGNKNSSESLKIIFETRLQTMSEQRQALDYESYWHEYVAGLPVATRINLDLENIENGAASTAIRLEQICNDIIDFAKKSYLYNERVSSELFNQPKPVDSIVDDFAVEAQNFANALTMSAAFAAGALAFRLVGDRVAGIASALLAAFNILISFGTITNSARYKIRNEEARVKFTDEELPRVMKGVFALMDRESQDALPLEMNPFVIDLERAVDIFLKNAAYYDEPEPTEFKDAYAKLKENINDPAAIRVFQRLLTTKFIVKTYHVNSYLQEYLVNIYKILHEMCRLLNEKVDYQVGVKEARRLFYRLVTFRSSLEDTLQRGPTRYGFVKQRKFSQWDAMAAIKYFYGTICCAGRRCSFVTAPISTITLGIVRQCQHLSGVHKSQILRREIRDLEALYWATRESDIASLIVMTGVLVFIASILFTVARIFDIDTLENVAFWATLASAFGALLATFHLVRKLRILFNLYIILGRKARDGQSTDDRDNIKKVRSVTGTQIALTLIRLFAALAASVALPWSVAENGFGDDIGTGPKIPTWIALSAVCLAILATFSFFVVEYVVRYNLSPNLGEFVCESFRDELENMYRIFSLPINSIDTKQVQERETWEYVAREFLHRYRFDAVFAADRFGNILQYIQGGMDPRQ